MPAFTAAAFNINKSVDKFVDILVDFFKEQDVNLKSPALDKPLGEASEMLKFRPKLLAYLKDQDYAPVPNSISRANFEKIVGDDDTSKVNVAFQKKLKELRDALPAAGNNGGGQGEGAEVVIRFNATGEATDPVLLQMEWHDNMWSVKTVRTPKDFPSGGFPIFLNTSATVKILPEDAAKRADMPNELKVVFYEAWGKFIVNQNTAKDALFERIFKNLVEVKRGANGEIVAIEGNGVSDVLPLHINFANAVEKWRRDAGPRDRDTNQKKRLLAIANDEDDEVEQVDPEQRRSLTKFTDEVFNHEGKSTAQLTEDQRKEAAQKGGKFVVQCSKVAHCRVYPHETPQGTKLKKVFQPKGLPSRPSKSSEKFEMASTVISCTRSSVARMLSAPMPSWLALSSSPMSPTNSSGPRRVVVKKTSRVSSTTAEIWRRTDSSSPTRSSSRRLRSSNRSLSLPF